MKTVFTQIISLSISASLIACLVMLLRLVLKKSPRFIICALWALVAVRLLVPALPESKVSLMPRQVSSGSLVEEFAARPVEATLRVKKSEPRYVKIIEKNPQIPVRYQGDEAYVEVSEKTLEAPKTVSSDIMPFLAWIWLGGAALMLAYMGFSYFRIWRKVGACLKRGEGIYICDNISSPFILGIIRPKIYLPSSLKEENKAYVIAHEEAHLKRLDHLWKPLGYLLLAFHWFNPLLWAAYILLCRDIEMACDEKVTGREGRAYRQAYSEALFACSAPARLVTACPLAFGEVGVKTRVKSVLHYKKPAFWLLIITLLACAVAAGCALTNRESSDAPTGPDIPGTEMPATTPAQEESTAPSPSETHPGEDSLSRVQPAWLKLLDQALTPEQEGVLQAKQVAFWPAVFQGKALYGEGPRGSRQMGPESFVFQEQYRNTCLLDRVNKRLLTAQQESPVGAYSLDQCRDPRLLAVISHREGEMDSSIYCVLDTESVFFFRIEYLQGLQQVDVLKLPEGLTGTDVSYMESYAISSVSDGLLLYTGRGCYLNREGSSEWELFEDGRVAPSYEAEQQISCWSDPETGRIILYNTRGEHLYASALESGDWLYVPENYLFRNEQGLYVMAPRADGISVYEVEVGVNRIDLTVQAEDRNLRLGEIQTGAVVALNGGDPVTEDYPGFRIDLDGDGKTDTVTLEKGVGNHDTLAFELYVNGLPAGTSHLRYHWSELGLDKADLIFPEEATFSREAGYRMYLASLDGETVTLFLESEEETYGLDLREVFTEEEGYSIVLSTRLRGPGKQMKDFVPCQPLEKYIEAGWLLRPFGGDELDLNGDGSRNRVELMYGRTAEGKCYPYAEIMHFDDQPVSTPLYYEGYENIFGDERGLYFRYGDLYYVPNDLGGYDIMGELSLNGRTIVQRYQLTDENHMPLQQGDDFTHAAYRSVGGYFRPLPGWEGVDDAIEAYFAKSARDRARLGAGELAKLRQFFEDLFVGHFLLEEYQTVTEIDPAILFYDGIPEDPWTGSGGAFSEEEKKLVLSVLPDGFTTRLYRAEAQTVFARYTDFKLDDVQKEIPFDYVEELDAWYWSKGDTENRHYSIVDAIVSEDGKVTALWRSLWTKPGQDDRFGLVTLRKSDDGWKILSNRFLKEEDLADLVDRGILRAWGEKVLDYDHEGSGWGKTEINWYGKPIRPVDYDYQVETGYMILDQAGKRLIVISSQGKAAALSLDFCSHPVQMAYVFGGGGREESLFVLDGKEVLRVRVKRDAAYEPIALELDQRIPLPEGLHASEVREIRSWMMPGGSDRALLLMSQDQGNYVLAPGSTAFTPTEEGWHMVREGSHVTIWQENARWELEIPEEDVRVLDIQTYGGREQYSLSLFVREKDGLSAEIRQYDARGQRGVSSLDLSDWTHTDCRMQGSGEKNYVMAPKKTGLYMYYVKPGLHNLQLVPDGLDYSFQQTEMLVLAGDVVALPELSASVTDPDRGLFLDFDQDGTQDALSIERSLDPEGRLGIEFYYKGGPAGASRTLGAAGMLRETEEPCFFTPEEEYRFYLASLDGRSISLMMSNAARTLAVEFVKLESNYGGVKGGYMARVRMRGEGKSMEDFKPCQGIHQYLEEGWEVRPSEGDRIVVAPGEEERIIHMMYLINGHHSEGSYYTEAIRVEDFPATRRGVSEGEYDMIYHRFDHLSYVVNDLGNLTILQGWMEDGSRETIYRLANVNGVISFQSSGPF
ncbi:MAG: hypothetical protein IJR95_01100 [Lachnospiraceae bacterium]|nr:hypothetical protein [Lachnospiraceae bacterium]